MPRVFIRSPRRREQRIDSIPFVPKMSHIRFVFRRMGSVAAVGLFQFIAFFQSLEGGSASKTLEHFLPILPFAQGDTSLSTYNTDGGWMEPGYDIYSTRDPNTNVPGPTVALNGQVAMGDFNIDFVRMKVDFGDNGNWNQASMIWRIMVFE